MTYKNDQLLLSAKRDAFEDHSNSQGNLLQSERIRGTLSRAYYLPGVDVAKINAQFKDGVLTVDMPKVAGGDSAGTMIQINYPDYSYTKSLTTAKSVKYDKTP